MAKHFDVIANEFASAPKKAAPISPEPLWSMIQYAYNVRDFQISGGPGWMATDRYDVTAKPENGAHDQQA